MRVLAVLLAVLPAASRAAPAPTSAHRAPRSAHRAPKAAHPASKAGPSSPQAAASAPKAAAPSPQAAPPAARPDPLGACTAALTARKVAWKPAARPGIALAVEVTGALGGVKVSSPNEPLVIDCSLAVSLAEAGPYLRNAGLDAATFSSAYSRRNVRGTNRPSKHSYGLAIDVAAFSGPALGTLSVDRDFEQGLGDTVDCLGRPLTQGGATLKLLQCQLARSGLFYLVLTPDYDDAHHDHFHLEVKPWSERTALRADTPAVY
jgi:hypothetical protein